MPEPVDTQSIKAERPKRLSLSQILEALLARGSADRSAVTIARNARGDTQFEVVVRTGDNSDVTDVLAAEQRATEIYDRLCVQYPRSVEGDVQAAQEELRKLNAERRQLKGDTK